VGEEIVESQGSYGNAEKAGEKEQWVNVLFDKEINNEKAWLLLLLLLLLFFFRHLTGRLYY
jgi:hypothetical protein